MIFNTAYSPGISKFHCKCQKIRADLQLNSSTLKLEKTGDDPYYERIQSYADSCRLSTKLERYRRGDLTALGTHPVQYFDASNSPGSLQEVLQAGDKIGDSFNRLPDSIRGIFNNSVSEFVSAVKDGSYESKVLEYAKSELAKSGTGNSKQVTGGNQGTEGGSK